jgi:DNA-binding NarL/FixJ family response regulator
MKAVQDKWSPNGKSIRRIAPGPVPTMSKPRPSVPLPKLAAKARRLETTLTEELRHGLRNECEVNSSNDRHVLLDKEVDGYRIVLIREQLHPGAHVNLSPREQEIARMIAKGYPNKAIAAVLEISCWTVGTHLRRIFAKLGVTCRAAMVSRLMELGLTRLWA